MAVKVWYLLMSLDLKIVKTVLMRGQKEGKKCMVKNKENEEKEKI